MPIRILYIIDFYTNIETLLRHFQKNMFFNLVMCLWDAISYYCLAYIEVFNGFYSKIFCGAILYCIVKYILVGYCVLCAKIFLGRYVDYGTYMVRGRVIVVRLPGSQEASSGLLGSLFEADDKPLRGGWEASCSRPWSWWCSHQASSRLMGSLLLPPKIVGRFPRSIIRAAEKPLRGW